VSDTRGSEEPAVEDPAATVEGQPNEASAAVAEPAADGESTAEGERSATTHRSIGEVLSLLQEEFPDVTISKIRFLESQGLIQPERTAAGYRKFYDADVERLRWILVQQRDHFLPLKVIRRMLADGVDRYSPSHEEQPTLWTPAPGEDAEPSGDGSADDEDASTPVGRGTAAPDAERSGASARNGSGRPGGGGRPPQSPAHPAVASAPRSRLETPADIVAALQEDPRPTRRGRGTAAGAAPGAGAPPDVETPTTGSAGDAEEEPVVPLGEESVHLPEELTSDAVCARFDVDGAFLADLERFGLVHAVDRGGDHLYDRDAIRVVELAAGAARLGAEPRHLRMYLVAAEREAGFVEQVVMPLLKQRNPAARARAAEVADELAGLGASLHRALLHRALRGDLGR
jgi:DNA-binding transcriptional MerR regulator